VTPLDEVSDQIRTQLESQAAAPQAEAFSAWLEEAISGADVSVSSRYGSWNAEEGRVEAPEPPSSGAATVSFE
jgi:hypothetical protein